VKLTPATADLLGSALTVRVMNAADADADAASRRRAEAVAATYPHATGGGPPVIHPQHPGVPIYHNSAIWPFATGQNHFALSVACSPLLTSP